MVVPVVLVMTLVPAATLVPVTAMPALTVADAVTTSSVAPESEAAPCVSDYAASATLLVRGSNSMAVLESAAVMGALIVTLPVPTDE